MPRTAARQPGARLRRCLFPLAAIALASTCAAAWTVQPAAARVAALVATTTSLGLSPDPPAQGQPTTLTATVSSSGGTPTGSVTFSDGGTTLDTVALSGGTATLTKTFGPGQHDLTATYATHYDPSSRQTFTTSTSSTRSFTFGSQALQTPTVSLPPGRNPSSVSVGDTVTLVATVSGGSPAPSGTVTFQDSANGGADVFLGTASVDSTTGVASLRTSGFLSGSNVITATYSGDSTYAHGDAATLSITGAAAPTKHDTTLTLGANPSSLSTSDSSTLTATVVDTVDGGDYPVGTVTFKDNGVLLATVELRSSDEGVATTHATGFVQGDNTITATYAPGTVDGVADSTHNGSNTASTVIAATAPATAVATAISASISPDPIVAGGSATLTAYVHQVGTAIAPPQGSIVTFRNAADGSLIGQATLDASGNGSVVTHGWQAGHYDITATYVGDTLNASASVGISTDVRAQAVLTIAAPSPTLAYGDPLPTLAPTYSGFANGEDATSLTTQPTCTTAAPGAAPGTYAVSCSGAADPYYTFVYLPGTLTVRQAPLTVTPDDLTMTLGDPVPSPTATISGFANGETLGTSDVTGSPACTTTATSSSPAGIYPITCTAGTLASTDYSFAVSGTGTLTVSTTGSVATTSIAWVGGPILVGEPVTLVGSLFSHWTQLAGKTMTLSLGTASCTATTSWLGFAMCSVVPTGPLGPTTSTASFAGDGTYAPSAGSRSAVLYAFPSGGGAFVVGDKSSSESSSVTFWGSQWWKSNSLSGGDPSHDFKGYAAQPSLPTIGSQWSSGSGNSASPPDAPLPSYMGVLVTRSAAKSGSSVGGTVVNIAVVETDSGYAPNPGHAGTGTIVASIHPLTAGSSDYADSESSGSGNGGSGGGGYEHGASPNDLSFPASATDPSSHRSRWGYQTCPAL